MADNAIDPDLALPDPIDIVATDPDPSQPQGLDVWLPIVPTPALDAIKKRPGHYFIPNGYGSFKIDLSGIFAKQKPGRKQVSTNGRDWVDYDRLLDADDFELYAHRREI